MTTVCQWNTSRGKNFSYVYTSYTANLRKWWGPPDGVFSHMSVLRLVGARREQLTDVKTALKTLKPKFDKAKKEFGLFA